MVTHCTRPKIGPLGREAPDTLWKAVVLGPGQKGGSSLHEVCLHEVLVNLRVRLKPSAGSSLGHVLSTGPRTWHCPPLTFQGGGPRLFPAFWALAKVIEEIGRSASRGCFLFLRSGKLMTPLRVCLRWVLGCQSAQQWGCRGSSGRGPLGKGSWGSEVSSLGRVPQGVSRGSSVGPGQGALVGSWGGIQGKESPRVS